MTTSELGDLGYGIAKAWRAVLAGTLCLFVLVAPTALLVQQRTYTSRMVAPLSPRMLGLLRTEVVLDGVVKASTLDRPSGDFESARKLLAARLVVSPELAPGSGLYSISVSDETPEGAQGILEEILTQLLSLSKPSGSSRSAMLQDLELLNDTHAHLKRLADKLAENAANVKAGDDGEMYARAFVHLISDISAKEAKIRELEDALEGMRREDLVVSPTFPAAPEPFGLGRDLVFAWFASFVLAALFVAIREARRRSASRSKLSIPP